MSKDRGIFNLSTDFMESILNVKTKPFISDSGGTYDEIIITYRSKLFIPLTKTFRFPCCASDGCSVHSKAYYDSLDFLFSGKNITFDNPVPMNR